jgi:hypothetical protein
MTFVPTESHNSVSLSSISIILGSLDAESLSKGQGVPPGGPRSLWAKPRVTPGGLGHGGTHVGKVRLG